MEHSAACSAECGDRRGLGTLLLTDDDLSFSGPFTLSMPLAAIDTLRVHRGVLEVRWPNGTAAFDLGVRQAQSWARLIRDRQPLIDKLGVGRGARVLVSGISDFGFRRQLKQRAAAVLDRSAAVREPNVDLAFVGAETRHDLAALPALAPLLARNGALWIVSPAAGDAVTEQDVLLAAGDAGLTLMKTVAFSATHTARKFVASRGRR